MQPSNHKPPRGASPDLLGKTSAALPDSSRILANLEHDDGRMAAAAPAPYRLGRTAMSAAILLLLTGALGWISWQNATAPGAGANGLPASALARMESRRALPAIAPDAPMPAVGAPADVAGQKAAAAIVNESMPAAPLATSPAAMPQAPDATLAPPRSSLAHGSGALSLPPARAPAIAAAASRPAASAKNEPAPARAKQTPAPSGTTASAADSDVALLTALVAHANNQTLPAAPEGRSAANRDVVQSKESETTESLLQRCKQLGLIEGMLCHSRICSGRWDSEAACNQ
ncbi:MAG TPA: hypothetical protein VGP06_08580 [Janthinobacterium sp.]|nr:hypothetical protein [Janthinobacterium sp.]